MDGEGANAVHRRRDGIPFAPVMGDAGRRGATARWAMAIIVAALVLGGLTGCGGKVARWTDDDGPVAGMTDGADRPAPPGPSTGPEVAPPPAPSTSAGPPLAPRPPPPSAGSPCSLADPGLEAAVRRAVKAPEGPLTEDLVGDLTALNATDQAILILDGIGCLRQLTELDLADNHVLDITPLESLTGLERLDLTNNDVTELAPLATLTSLRVLNLGNNHLPSLSTLPTLPRLTVLDVSGNMVRDLRQLRRVPALTTLNLSHTGVHDLGGLELLTRLAVLHLDGSRVDAFAPLSALPLQELSHEVTDGPFHLLQGPVYTTAELSPLWSITTLTSLRLTGVLFDTLAGLSRLPRLQSLSLLDCSIHDAEGFAKLEALESLETTLDIVGVEAVLPPNLRRLRLEDSRLEALDFLASAPHLQELELVRGATWNLQGLVGLPLESLTLEGPAGNLEPIGTLTTLKELRLGWPLQFQLESFLPSLSKLQGLETLQLDVPADIDLSSLSSLTKLRELSFTHDSGTPTELPVLPRLEPEPQTPPRLSGPALAELGPDATVAGQVRAALLVPVDDRPWTEVLPTMPDLRHLAVAVTDADDLSRLATAAPGLRDLELYGDVDPATLPPLPLLRSLQLNGKVCSRAAEIPTNLRLRELRIRGEECGKLVALPPRADHLRILDISTGSDVDLGDWGRFPELLDVRFEGIGGRPLTLTRLRGHPSLQRLSLFGNVDAWSVGPAGYPALQELTLGAGLTDLSPMGSLPALKSLGLKGNVDAFPDMPSLESLSTFRQVTSLPPLPTLRTLLHAPDDGARGTSIPTYPQLRYLLGRGVGLTALVPQPRLWRADLERLRVSDAPLGNLPSGTTLGSLFPAARVLAIDMAVADSLSIAPSVRSLTVTAEELRDVGDLASALQLAVLNLEARSGTIGPLPTLPGLRSLTLSGGASLATTLTAQPQLRVLWLSADHPLTIPSLPELRRLTAYAPETLTVNEQPKLRSALTSARPAAPRLLHFRHLTGIGSSPPPVTALTNYPALIAYEGRWPSGLDDATAAGLGLRRVTTHGPLDGIGAISTLDVVDLGDTADLAPIFASKALTKGDRVIFALTQPCEAGMLGLRDRGVVVRLPDDCSP